MIGTGYGLLAQQAELRPVKAMVTGSIPVETATWSLRLMAGRRVFIPEMRVRLSQRSPRCPLVQWQDAGF